MSTEHLRQLVLLLENILGLPSPEDVEQQALVKKLKRQIALGQIKLPRWCNEQFIESRLNHNGYIRINFEMPITDIQVRPIYKVFLTLIFLEGKIDDPECYAGVKAWCKPFLLDLHAHNSFNLEKYYADILPNKFTEALKRFEIIPDNLSITRDMLDGTYKCNYSGADDENSVSTWVEQGAGFEAITNHICAQLRDLEPLLMQYVNVGFL